MQWDNQAHYLHAGKGKKMMTCPARHRKRRRGKQRRRVLKKKKTQKKKKTPLKKEKQAAAAPQPRVVRRLSDFISSN
jgi:hypothetical protein